MAERDNLAADIDWVGADDERQEVARVCVKAACRYTRDGGAPTITIDCADSATLEGEVKRLKRELDAALAEVREHFGDQTQAPATDAPETVSAPANLELRSSNLLVRDIMTRDVKTMHRNEALSLGRQLMDIGHFRHVVVLDEDNRLVGVISRQDVYHGALAWSLGLGESAHEKALKQVPAKAVMQTAVVTTTPTTNLADAARTMIDKKIGCLPVLEGAELVGILTEGDFLALMVR